MELKTTIIEEQDEEERLNPTQNPTENNKILLAYTEEVQRPHKIEINAKTSNTIEFHLKHYEKRENLPFEQLIPEVNLIRKFPLQDNINLGTVTIKERLPGTLEYFTTILTFSMKTKPKDSLDHAHGIIKLN